MNESFFILFYSRLQALEHLQRVGVCHRDMSLENILIDEYRTSIVIDLGMCLKVPYSDYDTGGVCTVASGTLRRLIQAQIPCGKPNYISPEVLQSDEPFDGFAIDLWATAVILFIMLVGLPPWVDSNGCYDRGNVRSVPRRPICCRRCYEKTPTTVSRWTKFRIIRGSSSTMSVMGRHRTMQQRSNHNNRVVVTKLGGDKC
jgi:serine/threonine protein kinase